MVKELGVIMLAELDPARAARCEHRKCLSALYALDKLVSLLHDSEVGSNVHIKHAVCAESSDSSNHFAFNICAHRHIESLTESSSYSRSCEEYYLLLGVCQSVPNLVLVALFTQSADRASNDTLTAAYARRLHEVLIESTVNTGLETSVDLADNGNALNVLAGSDTSHALNALVVISDEIR